MLDLEWSERCKNTAEVISIAMDVGLPIHFTQLEQIFSDAPTVYPVEELLKHCSTSGDGERSPDQSHDLMEAEEKTEVSSSAKDKSCDGTATKSEHSSLSAEGAALSMETEAVRTKVELSSEKICTKLKSFLEKRDGTVEKKLKELFEAAQTSTAKENLLLSLR